MEKRIVISFTKVKRDDFHRFASVVARKGEKITTVTWRLIQEYTEKEGREDDGL